MNAKKYITILDEKLLTFMQTHNCKLFMQDGAPCHQVALVKNWLRDHGVKIFLGIAASIGSLFSGICIDQIRRKSTILMISTIYLFGYAEIIFSCLKIQNSANFANLFTYFGCVSCGIGFGMTSLAVPVYIAEVSSPRLRGTMGAITHYVIVLGIFVSYLTADANYGNINICFSALIGLALILFSFLIVFMPESPRWLLANNQREKAFKSQFWLLGIKSDAEDECNQIEINLAHQHTASINDFRSPGLFRPLLIGTCIVLHLLFSLLGCYIVHKISRRRLLLFGSTILLEVDERARVAYFFMYDIVFTFTWGPLPWIIVSEIFPSRARGLLGGILRSLIWWAIFPLETRFTLADTEDYSHGCPKGGRSMGDGGCLSLKKLSSEFKHAKEQKIMKEEGKSLTKITNFFGKLRSTPNTFDITQSAGSDDKVAQKSGGDNDTA
ncbi:glucose transporter GlcP-like [Hydra vulgaris]|uniref:Glucose transporter GlcP-like n=1 Tax=Hydra vulgaris TaxID=6087 RepID=A0ABM4B1R1_HYDVU